MYNYNNTYYIKPKRHTQFEKISMASQSTPFGEEISSLLSQDHSCRYSICLFVIMVFISDR